MQKVIIAASLLLIIQVGLIVALNVNTRNMDAFVPQENLLEFEADFVNTVSIQGEESRVVLQKKEGSWVLPDAYSVPADTAQVSVLLSKLTELNQGLAVATSKEAAKRFKVSEDVFERHLVLSKDDQVVADLYVGTSPGFKQAHVRRADRDEIVTASLSTFELEPVAEKWLDKTLGQVKEEEIKTLDFPTFSLSREAESWKLSDIAPGEQVNAEEVKSLLKKVSDVAVQDVLDPKVVALLFEENLILKFSITMKDDNTIDYLFVKPEADHYVFKRSDRDFYFKVSNWVYDDLKAFDREKLLNKVAQANPEEGK